MEVTIKLEQLADMLGRSAGEIAEALKEGEGLKGADEVSRYVKGEIEKMIEKSFKRGSGEGHGRGKREVLTEAEKNLKAKYGVEGDGIDEVVSNIVDQVRKNTEIDPNDVKNSELFISETKKLKERINDLEAEKNQAQERVKKERVKHLVKQKAGPILKKHNFILPDDPNISHTLLSHFYNSLEDENTIIDEKNEDLFVLDKDGRQKENPKNFKDVTIDDHILAKAKEYFPQAKSDNRSSPGEKTENFQSSGNGASSFDVKGMDDTSMLKHMQSLETAKEKKEFKQKWEEANA